MKAATKSKINPVNPSKIVERIVKGFKLMSLSDHDIQNQRNYVAATIHGDYDRLDAPSFVRKYIEWIPSNISAAVLDVKPVVINALIQEATSKQPKAHALNETPEADQADEAGVEDTGFMDQASTQSLQEEPQEKDTRDPRDVRSTQRAILAMHDSRKAGDK